MNTLRDKRIELNRQKRRAEDQLRQYRNRSLRVLVSRSSDPAYSAVGHKEPRINPVVISDSPASPSDDGDYGTDEWTSDSIQASSLDESELSGRQNLTESVDAAKILAAVANLSSGDEEDNKSNEF
jgi:hypothetical protein